MEKTHFLETLREELRLNRPSCIWPDETAFLQADKTIRRNWFETTYPFLDEVPKDALHFDRVVLNHYYHISKGETAYDSAYASLILHPERAFLYIWEWQNCEYIGSPTNGIAPAGPRLLPNRNILLVNDLDIARLSRAEFEDWKNNVLPDLLTPVEEISDDDIPESPEAPPLSPGTPGEVLCPASPREPTPYFAKSPNANTLILLLDCHDGKGPVAKKRQDLDKHHRKALTEWALDFLSLPKTVRKKKEKHLSPKKRLTFRLGYKKFTSPSLSK
jgi:hypothetical protein